MNTICQQSVNSVTNVAVKNKTPQKNGELNTCLECGKLENKEKLIKFKKFCSSECSKKFNNKNLKSKFLIIIFF